MRLPMLLLAAVVIPAMVTVAGCAPPRPQVPTTPALPDADQDGISDILDACDGSKEDGLAPAPRDGCPQDADGDGVLGAADKCGDKREVVNGYLDGDGCPDTAPPPPKPKVEKPRPKLKPGMFKKVKLAATRIEINEKVQFATGSAHIQEGSNELLDEVAGLLKKHDDIDFVEIAGHADIRGYEQTNLRLTRDRAQAVRAALVARGVAEARLRAVGYGVYCPLDPARNDEAYTKNRRVEFLILRRAGQDLKPVWGGCDDATAKGITPQPIPTTAPSSKPPPVVAAKPEPAPEPALKPEPKPEPKPAPVAAKKEPESPVKPLAQACDGGQHDACIKLALMLEGGSGVTPDLAAATKAYSVACDGGALPGCTGLGGRLEIDAKAHGKAEAHFSRACVGGEQVACERLGLLYEHGWGVKAELRTALKLYRKACVGGVAPACADWGELVFAGRGVEADPEFGVALLGRSCEMHWQPACDRHLKLKAQLEVPSVAAEADVKLSVDAEGSGSVSTGAGASVSGGGSGTVEVDLPECTLATKDACERGCELGDARSCDTLGLIYAYGTAGASVDVKKALELFAKASASGHLQGHVHTGLVFEGGVGVQIDLAKAREQFKLACDGSEYSGCTHLGSLYLHGKGIPNDTPKAKTLFERACNGGDPNGCHALGLLFQGGIGVKVDLGRAKQLFGTACDGGVVAACSGWGVVTVEASVDMSARAEGIAMIRWACDQSYQHACLELKRLAVCEFGEIEDCKLRCEKGDAKICATLGGYYAEGRWVAQSHIDAQIWFKAAYDASAKICEEK